MMLRFEMIDSKCKKAERKKEANTWHDWVLVGTLIVCVNVCVRVGAGVCVCINRVIFIERVNKKHKRSSATFTNSVGSAHLDVMIIYSK